MIAFSLVMFRRNVFFKDKVLVRRTVPCFPPLPNLISRSDIFAALL